MTETHQENYLVTGVSGFQGGAVARLLAARGHRVRGLSRGVSGSQLAIPGVTMVAADLANPDDVQRAFDGITHASVVLPLAFDTKTVLGYARNVADAAQRAGVRRLVFNTSAPIPAVSTPYAAFETKREAEAVFRESGVPLVILRPKIYLDNLFSPWNGPAIVNQGVVAYPVAADRGVAWLSHADLALATAAALSRDDLVGQVLDVGGREVVTGAELAEAFTRALGREVRYHALSVDDFEAGLAQAVGPDAAAGVAGIYRWVDSDAGRDLLEIDGAAVQKKLGIELTPLSEWISGQPWGHWAATGTDEH